MAGGPEQPDQYWSPLNNRPDFLAAVKPACPERRSKRPKAMELPAKRAETSLERGFLRSRANDQRQEAEQGAETGEHRMKACVVAQSAVFDRSGYQPYADGFEDFFCKHAAGLPFHREAGPWSPKANGTRPIPLSWNFPTVLRRRLGQAIQSMSSWRKSGTEQLAQTW